MTATTFAPRLPNWPARLSALVAAAHARAFAWGAFDCCLWAADAGVALTGIDHAADLRGQYSDEAGALQVLQRIGGLRGAADRGGPRIRPGFAWEGDVGLVRSAGKPCLAVKAGAVWLCATKRGLFQVPTGAAVLAWGVGHA